MKFKKLLLIFTLIMFTSNICYADVVLPKEENMPINASWEIEFNKTIDSSTVNIDSVRIVDDKEKVVYSTYIISENKVKIIPIANLELGKEYTIQVKYGIKSKDGSVLEDIVVKKFKTTSVSDEDLKVKEYIATTDNYVSNMVRLLTDFNNIYKSINENPLDNFYKLYEMHSELNKYYTDFNKITPPNAFKSSYMHFNSSLSYFALTVGDFTLACAKYNDYKNSEKYSDYIDALKYVKEGEEYLQLTNEYLTLFNKNFESEKELYNSGKSVKFKSENTSYDIEEGNNNKNDELDIKIDAINKSIKNLKTIDFSNVGGF